MPFKNRICKKCNAEFSPRQYNQKNCFVCVEKAYPHRIDPRKYLDICKGCGGEFEKYAPRQHYCSDECKGDNMYYIRCYGITKFDVEQHIAEHGNNCQICGGDPFKINPKDRLGLAIDHDHKTGEIRGLLCHNCNRALGLLKENVDVFKKAIWYLTERATTIRKRSTPKQVEAQNKGRMAAVLDDIV